MKTPLVVIVPSVAVAPASKNCIGIYGNPLEFIGVRPRRESGPAFNMEKAREVGASRAPGLSQGPHSQEGGSVNTSSDYRAKGDRSRPSKHSKKSRKRTEPDPAGLAIPQTPSVGRGRHAGCTGN